MNKANFLILLISIFNPWNLFSDAVFMKKYMKEAIVHYYLVINAYY